MYMCVRSPAIDRNIFIGEFKLISVSLPCRYLYRELKNFYEGNRHVSIFTTRSFSQMLGLKEGVTLHLYLNAAPSGDGARFVRDFNPSITEADLQLMMCGAHYPIQEPDTAQGTLTAICGGGMYDISLFRV